MTSKKNRDLFKRLTRLFKSGPVVKRKIRSYDTVIASPDHEKSSAALLFQRSFSPTYSRITANAYNLSERLMRYQDFCLTGDTLVAVLNDTGYMRLDEIVDKWNSGDRHIYTYSYDVQDNVRVVSKITGAKYNGKRNILHVVLDDGTVFKSTPDHRFMLCDGTYVEAKDLTKNSKLMSMNLERSVKEIQNTDEIEDVYDIEVADYSNFALVSNLEKHSYSVFVHNCEMELFPELSSALDIFADEVMACDDKGKSLHIYSDNEKIKELLDELFYGVLNFEFNGRLWARNLCKFGDFILYNDVHPERGIVNAFPIPVNEIEREENFDREDPFAIRYRWAGAGNRTLENWEVTHFRLLGNDAFLPYGSSVLDPARRIWRQLILIEDAMLVYRIVRAPERRVFYVDVANLPPAEVPMYIEEMKKNLRSNQVIDQATGRVDLRYNPFSVDEDFLIPVRGNESGTKIDTLAGGQNTAAVEDVAYIQKKLFAALKIPKAYLSYDEGVSSKATLASEDIRFSRTITSIQKMMIAELNKLAIIHLYAHGYSGEDLGNFNLKLSNPSSVAQQQKLELWRSKFEIAGNMPEGMGSKEFIYREIWGLDSDQINNIADQQLRERVYSVQLDNVSEPDTEELFGNAGGNMGGAGAEGSVEAGAEELETAGEEPEEEQDPDLELLISGDEPSPDEKPIFEKDEPVKVNSQIKRTQYNRSRQRTHGSSKTHIPDFGKMTSEFDSISDPYDDEYRKSIITNPFKEGRDFQYFVKPEFPEHVKLDENLKCVLNHLDQKFGFGKRMNSTKLISEAVDIQDEIDGKNFVIDTKNIDLTGIFDIGEEE